MATTPISVEEYLHTAYEPDAEYVDGVIEERNVGEEKHSNWQMAIAGYFWQRRVEWTLRVRPELRTKTGERRYRIPDVAIFDRHAPHDPIALVPPLLAFEILSPEDRLSRLLLRLSNFETMGVAGIYVVDPQDDTLLRYQGGKLEAISAIAFRDWIVPFSDLQALLD